jgi:hypothetical protein
MLFPNSCVFYIHSEKTYIQLEKTYTEWIPQLIDSQIHRLILSLLAFEASTIIPIMFYLELLKPWMQDVHNVSYKILEGVCNGM